MTFLSSLTDQNSTLVLDASVVINLLATGHSSAILRALNAPIVVTDNVVREIEGGTSAGHSHFDLLNKALGDQILRMEKLDGKMLEIFFDLVSGSTAETLGDGEAATLALAHGYGFIAAIDEKKATRISVERFGTLKLATTVDILAHEAVRSSLGAEGLAEATFDAIRLARMQVREYQFDWVARTIGQARVDACLSLKKYARRRPAAGQN
jgi:predicted nucleic acid-binding protein